MQTADMGLTRDSLESYLVRIGYWADMELRRRNAYVLSPSAYVVSARQRYDLERLSRATYAAVKQLSSKLTFLANEKSISNSDARFLALATSSTRGLRHPSQSDGAVPPVMKVDLVQNAEGKYFIAEVDAYNPRGFGYLGFLDETVPQELRLGGRGMGITGLADLMRRSSRYDYGEWVLIASDFERYYEPSFNILSALLKERGVYLNVIRECEKQDSAFRCCNVFCVPESMHKNISARSFLAEEWKSGGVHLFYPPAAYLGSKAFLPFLRTQQGMDEFIPDCSLVDKKNDPLPAFKGTPVVLKGVMSSGLKKVIFSDAEQERFAKEYAVARATKNPQWVLQAQVPQQPVPIIVFDNDGERITRDHFLRITAYVTEDGLLGAEVTGRPDKAVHGAPDCIQIPAIYA